MKACLKTVLIIWIVFLIYTTAFLIHEYLPNKHELSNILNCIGNSILAIPLYSYFSNKEKVK